SSPANADGQSDGEEAQGMMNSGHFVALHVLGIARPSDPQRSRDTAVKVRGVGDSVGSDAGNIAAKERVTDGINRIARMPPVPNGKRSEGDRDWKRQRRDQARPPRPRTRAERVDDQSGDGRSDGDLRRQRGTHRPAGDQWPAASEEDER